MKRFISYALVMVFIASTAHASRHDAEQIEFLLTEVGASECVFIRNGSEHAAEDAEEHLRMKYRRAKNRVKSVENFISRIATKSSLSGKPYLIRCGKSEAQAAADWLAGRLSRFSGSDGKLPEASSGN